MRFEVVLTADAERDLEDLYTYIVEHDSKRSADHVLARLLELADNLAVSPTRAAQPRELRAVGDQEYRQVFFRPYRLIYRTIGQRVVVYLISDGRRDMQTLLARRLLGA